MASTVNRKRRRPSTARHQPVKIADMTKEELRALIETSVEHKLAEWFGDPEDMRDEQEWARQFAASQDTLDRLADEALKEFHQGKTEPLDPSHL